MHMRFKILSLILGLALAGCFSTEEQSPLGADKTGANDTTRIVYVLDSALLAVKLDSLRRVNDSLRLIAVLADSIKNDRNGIGGWDDFPNKYRPTLEEIATRMQRLPVPMGTRYSGQPTNAPAAKTAATQACGGISEIAAIRYNNNTIYGVDTISYYDSLDQPHCDWQTPTTRETHARHMINDASGEVWEKLDIRILDERTLPNYLTHGTGRMVLNNGTRFTIDAYDVDMIILYGDSLATIRSASLAMTWQDGYSFKLDLVKPKPFKAVDFFPAWGYGPALGRILSGPILHPGSGTREGLVDTVGFVDLYADHSVDVRDWAGSLVRPAP